MELWERIRKLRKEYLHLSQTEFGEKLGVSRSVINNMERGLLARPEHKISLIKLMCKEFSISEEWLLNGKGDMFAVPDKAPVSVSFDASPLEVEAIKAYFELDPYIRKVLAEHLLSHFASVDFRNGKNGRICLIEDKQM